jgi:hypothetical protein
MTTLNADERCFAASQGPMTSVHMKLLPKAEIAEHPKTMWKPFM